MKDQSMLQNVDITKSKGFSDLSGHLLDPELSVTIFMEGNDLIVRKFEEYHERYPDYVIGYTTYRNACKFASYILNNEEFTNLVGTDLYLGKLQSRFCSI